MILRSFAVENPLGQGVFKSLNAAEMLGSAAAAFPGSDGCRRCCLALGIRFLVVDNNSQAGVQSAGHNSRTEAGAPGSRPPRPRRPPPTLGPRQARLISRLLLPNISLVLNRSRFPSLIVYALEIHGLHIPIG
jgi:hypothetical protein